MDEILIDKVREHEVIYNHVLPEYRDQNIRQAAWEEIGRELQISGNKAKERWDGLRRCFCNAINRRRYKTRRGMASKKKSFWKYDQQMSFIIPYLGSRKAHCNLSQYQTEPEDLSEEWKAEESTLGPSEQQHINLNTEYEIRIKDNLAGNNDETVEKLMNTPAERLVRIVNERSDLRSRQYEEKSMLQDREYKTTCFSETLDETDMFFLSMAKMAKQLPKVEQAHIKLALSNSVLSAEIRYNQHSMAPTLLPQRSYVGSPSPDPSSTQP